MGSRFGSGAFGRWTVDPLGLPAFRYLVDQERFAPARQPELRGATEAQHQLGNDHIVAAAFNHGYTQLWSQDRLPQWANHYDPGRRHYGGGYGYLNVGGRVLSTLYLDRPRGAATSASSAPGTTSAAWPRRALTCASASTRRSATTPCWCTT